MLAEHAPPEALALTAREGNAMRLMAVDPLAAEMGLAPGMTLSDARARCPSLETLPHDPEADSRELDRVVVHMRRFSPMVMADPPHGVLLDITGCVHLFGGEEALARQACEASGFTARHALADNPAAARALARYGQAGQDIRALPVAALELPGEQLIALRRAGLRRLGDLAQRPSSALAARFGEHAVLRLRRILGEVASPLAPLQPMAPIRAKARFAEPIARTEDVLDVAEDLLRQTASQMEERHLGGRRFVLTLYRSDGATRRLAVETGQPVRDPAPVMRLLRERIDGLSDPIDPGFGFDAITLAVPRCESLPARQIAIEQDQEGTEEHASALTDRLMVRLGTDSVYRLAARDRHLPERAQRTIPPGAKVPPCPWLLPGALPRPLYLLDPPQRVDVIAAVPDGPPQRFRWRGTLHEVRLAEGPERIATEWWRFEQGHMGEAAPTRDYYRIEDSQGRRFWLFRHGLFSEKPDPGWFVHGLFA